MRKSRLVILPLLLGLAVTSCGGRSSATGASETLEAAQDHARKDVGMGMSAPIVRTKLAHRSGVGSGEVASELAPALPCREAGGRVVKLGLYTDVSIPACARVTPNQRILIVNRTSAYHRSEAKVVTVRLGRYSARIEPQQAALFPRPTGAFLGLGNSSARTTSVSGPTILVLRKDCDLDAPIPASCLEK